MEEISREANIDSVTWFLVICRSTLKKSEWSKEMQKMYHLKRKRVPENLMLEPRFVPKKIRRLGRGSDLKWNKCEESSRQDHTQLSFQLVKGHGLKNFMLLNSLI